MQVNTLAKETGVSPDTVRFYTREGLLKPRKNPANGYKLYDRDDLGRLNFITAARSLGFTVADIHRILDVAEGGETPCPVVREIIETRLQELEERFRQMSILRERMLAAIDAWKDTPDKQPSGDSICHLIESFKS